MRQLHLRFVQLFAIAHVNGFETIRTIGRETPTGFVQGVKMQCVDEKHPCYMEIVDIYEDSVVRQYAPTPDHVIQLSFEQVDLAEVCLN